MRVVSASAPGPAPRQRRRRGSCGSLCAFPDMPRQREALYDSGRTNPGVPANASITEVACWAHCRRKFFDVWQATKSPVAKEALDRIAATDLSPKFPPLRSRVLGCRHARRDGVSRSGRALFLCPGRFPGHRRAQPGSRLAAGHRRGSVSFRAYWSHDTLSSPVKRPPGCRVRSPFGACDESVASSQARVGACGIGRAGNFGVRRATGNSALLTWCS